ncbi:unnamed protein product [Diplocarpon coronariae]
MCKNYVQGYTTHKKTFPASRVDTKHRVIAAPVACPAGGGQRVRTSAGEPALPTAKEARAWSYDMLKCCGADHGRTRSAQTRGGRARSKALKYICSALGRQTSHPSYLGLPSKEGRGPRSDSSADAMIARQSCPPPRTGPGPHGSAPQGFQRHRSRNPNPNPNPNPKDGLAHIDLLYSAKRPPRLEKYQAFLTLTLS